MFSTNLNCLYYLFISICFYFGFWINPTINFFIFYRNKWKFSFIWLTEKKKKKLAIYYQTIYYHPKYCYINNNSFLLGLNCIWTQTEIPRYSFWHAVLGGLNKNQFRITCRWIFFFIFFKEISSSWILDEKSEIEFW